MKRRAYLSTVALTGLAGCKDSISIEDQNVSESDQDLSEQQKRKQYESCGETLSIAKSRYNQSEVMNTGHEIISYQQLSERQKSEFKRAIDGGMTDFNGSWDPQSFIGYQDEYYKVSIAVC